MTGPIITNALPIRKYGFGNYVAQLWCNIESVGPIKYRYILSVLQSEETGPLIHVTAEEASISSEMLKIVKEETGIDLPTDKGSLVLGLFAADDHSNLGSSPDWADRNTFAEEALRVAYRTLGLPPDTQPRIIDDNTGELDWLPEDDQRKPETRISLVWLAVAVLSLATAIAYFSAQ